MRAMLEQQKALEYEMTRIQSDSAMYEKMCKGILQTCYNIPSTKMDSLLGTLFHVYKSNPSLTDRDLFESFMEMLKQ